MTIAHPEVLAGMLVLIPLTFFQIRAYVLGRREVMILGSHLSPDRVSNLFIAKWFLTAFAFDIFVMLSILAAAGISWGERPVEEDRTGLEVAIAIDVSRSMLAADATPDRLSQGLGLVRAMARELSSTGFSLVTFKGDASILMPMTSDINAIDIVVEGVSPALVSAPGTDIGAGLRTALERFSAASLAHRAIILISDGEALSGTIDGPLDRARRDGIPVFTVMAGTVDGAPVPAPDGTPMVDEDGRPIVSRADPRFLREIAAESGGEFFRLDDPTGVDDAIRAIEQFAQTREREGFRLIPRPRYRLFLSGALVALLLSLVVRLIKWRGMF